MRPWLVWSWALLDDHRNGARGLGRVENPRAVGFAIHPQPFGQANDDSFPCDVTAEVFLEFGATVAGLALGPIMIVGSYVGKRIVDRLPERVFVAIIELVLVGAGLSDLPVFPLPWVTLSEFWFQSRSAWRLASPSTSA